MEPSEGSAPSLWSRGPRIRALSSIQAEFILSRNHVGRLAFIADGQPELLPLHYVFRHGQIIGRTSFGSKCLTWAENPSVTFGVDESDGLFDWRSVIIRGTLRALSHHGTRDERASYWRAVAAIRTLVPGALTERDPVADRRVVFTIDPVEIAGREASTRFLPG